ncbi:hypothetical protein [Mucilaginibacter sp. PAMB04168]|uniref:hypothetical protein n=1 Tax=Mucilaginibacter sp. PAMB04168 TaxID=3138567 RepID=UPI0031F611FA
MKRLILLAVTAFMLSSCSKSGGSGSTEEVKPTAPLTPVHEVIDSKYIAVYPDYLDIDYTKVDPNGEITKKLIDAAIKTINQSNSFNNVYVKGKTLGFIFRRGKSAQPSTISLNSSSNLYKEVTKNWSWNGVVTIRKQNILITKEQYEQMVKLNVKAFNTFEQASVLSKVTSGDVMVIKFALAKNKTADKQILSYDLQASTPITFTPQFEINCLIPGFYDRQTDVLVDIPDGPAKPAQRDLGAGVISYTQDMDGGNATDALNFAIARQYYQRYVVPNL